MGAATYATLLLLPLLLSLFPLSQAFFRDFAEIRTSQGQGAKKGKPVIREIQAKDLPQVVDLAEREFGAQKGSWLVQVENEWFRWIVDWGFRQRIFYPDPLDHKAFVLLDDDGIETSIVDQKKDTTGEEGEDVVIGIVEISSQPVTGWSPPPFALPPIIKRGWSLLGIPLAPYISNLLIDSRARRKGYGKLMIQACEDYASNMLNKDVVYLHADLDFIPAVKLYEKLDYIAIKDDSQTICTERFGKVRLRYYCKKVQAPPPSSST